jgi:hypothetical protein
MTRLTLNEQEREVLVELLESAISDLGFEIADTDRMEFRERLKENRAVLKRILEILRTSGESDSTPDT